MISGWFGAVVLGFVSVDDLAALPVALLYLGQAVALLAGPVRRYVGASSIWDRPARRTA